MRAAGAAAGHDLSLDFKRFALLGNTCPFPASGTSLNGSVDASPALVGDTDTSSPLDDMSAEDLLQALTATGQQEQLPPQDMIDELEAQYFTHIHPTMPIIHRPRYMASLHLPAAFRPPIALRYAMWALAACMLPQYENQNTMLYARARHYLQEAEMQGAGVGLANIGICQAWTLVCMFEFTRVLFIRSWMSSGRASRLAQMMGLLRLDGEESDFKKCMPPPRDCVEREERRRTFWAAYSLDRFASIGTGWPCTINDDDISTRLPCNDDAFEAGVEEVGPGMHTVLNADCTNLSPFAAQILVTAQLTRNMQHLHRPRSGNDADPRCAFWKRHRDLDALFIRTARELPRHLRLPSGAGDANVIFLNLCLQVNIICLHQAAICRAEKHALPSALQESKDKCMDAAQQIMAIMRVCPRHQFVRSHPFNGFALYVACRVFLQTLKERPDDAVVRRSMGYLQSVLAEESRWNLLMASFLAQLRIEAGQDVENQSTSPYDLRARDEKYIPRKMGGDAFPGWICAEADGQLPGMRFAPSPGSVNGRRLDDQTPPPRQMSAGSHFARTGWDTPQESDLFSEMPSLVPENSTAASGTSGATSVPSAGPSPGPSLFGEPHEARSAEQRKTEEQRKMEEQSVFETLLSGNLFDVNFDADFSVLMTGLD